MPTVTTSPTALADGSTPVRLANAGPGVAVVTWEGHLEYLLPTDGALTVDSQGRAITATARGGNAEVTVTAVAKDLGLQGTGVVASDDISVLDGGSA